MALKDSLARVARECPNVSFATLDVDASADARALGSELGVSALPTVQYYKGGKLLFSHAGAVSASTKLDESVLFLASTPASELVTQVACRADLDGFIASCAAPATAVRGITIAAPCEQQLAALDVSLELDSPACVHVYPAVLALAKNMAGAVRWSRLLGDSGAPAAALMKELGVTSVPTFILYTSDGKEVGRYSGSDRGQLMACVLEAMGTTGYKLPSPPPRKRPSVAEAKKIAAEARARDKAAGRAGGW